MLRAAFYVFGLTLYILIVGPPLLLYSFNHQGRRSALPGGHQGRHVLRPCGRRGCGSPRARAHPQGYVIFAANHTSSADAPAIVWSIPRRIAILLKRSLFEWPIVGQAFHLAHFVPVDRFNRESAISSLEKATQSLRQGQSFLIYPEGTRSPDGRLQEFKKGTAVMAIKSGVPIVPVACSGAHRVMKKGKLNIYPGKILVEFFPPIDPTQYTLEQREQLNQRVHDELAAGLPPDQRPMGFPGAA